MVEFVSRVIYKLKSENHLVQHSKQHHREVLFSSFHENDHAATREVANHLLMHKQ